MKRITLTLICALSFGISCLAQSIPNNNSTAPLYILKIKGKPDIYLDGVFNAYLSTIKQTSIKSMEVWKDNKTTAKFGDKGKNGVIQITLVDSAKLLLTNDLIKNFKFKKHDRKLPVYVNNTQLYKPEKMYFDVSAIKSITLQVDTNSHQQYISIITDNYQYKRGTVNIRGAAR